MKLYRALQVVLAVISLYVFYNKLMAIDFKDNSVLWASLKENSGLFLLAFFLAVLNWIGESRKFQLLLKSYFPLGLSQAFLAVLSGMTISNFSPARSGEFIGRVLALKEADPIKVTTATIICNIIQVGMTYVIGALSLVFVLMTETIEFEQLKMESILFSSIAVALFLLFYFTRKWWIRLFNKFFRDKTTEILEQLKNYSRADISSVTLLSLLRYLAFSVQFFIIILVFSDFSIPYYSVLFIPSIYLLQSLIPVPPLSDIGVRLVVCELIFAEYLSNSAIFHSVIVLWIMSFIIPSILGSFNLLFLSVRN